jgi:heme exporter protein B
MTTQPLAADKPRSQTATSSWWSEAFAVLMKDVRSELRTRAALATILLFSVSVLLITAFLMPTHGWGLDRVLRPLPEIRQILDSNPKASQIDLTIGAGTSEVAASILSALIWIVLFFSAMAGLPRAFQKEEEMRTAAALRLAARPTAVFAGKLTFNAMLMLVTAAVIQLPFLFLFQPVILDWPGFLALIPLGALSMAGAATIVGAIVARAGGKTYLMLPLALPILLPDLIFAINGTTVAITGKQGNQPFSLVSDLMFLGAYLVMMVTVSAFLFEWEWND